MIVSSTPQVGYNARMGMDESQNKSLRRSGTIALTALAVVSGVLWIVTDYNPIFVFGGAGVLWLCALMLGGIFSRPFKPFLDDPPDNDVRT